MHKILFLCLFGGVFVGCQANTTPPQHSPKQPPTPALEAPDRVPDGLSAKQWRHIQQQIQQDQLAFKRVGQSWRFERNRLSGQVDPQGRLHLSAREHRPETQLVWSLERWGRVAQERQMSRPVEIKHDAGRLDVRYDGVTMWYHQRPSSLMQGFDVAQRPAGQGALRLVLSTNEAWQVLGGGQRVTIRDGKGDARWQYQRVIAWDRQGQPLTAHMDVVDDHHLALVIDDQQAQYPITVDPIIEAIDDWAPILPHENSPDAQMGTSVAVWDKWLAVGAPGHLVPRDPLQPVGAGAVFLFQDRSDNNGPPNWVLHSRFDSPTPDTVAGFGTSVAMDNGVLVVGEPRAQVMGNPATNDAGRVVLYTHFGQQWFQQGVVEPPVPTSGSRFGDKVLLDSAGYLLISAPEAATNVAGNSGKIYIFKDNGEGEYTWDGATIIPQEPFTKLFGSSMSLDDNTLAVGAHASDRNGSGNGNGSEGAVFVYRRANQSAAWLTHIQIVQPTASQSEFFGWDVSLDDDLLLIGAPNYVGANGVATGAAFLYQRDANDPDKWTQLHKLLSPFGQAGDEFGNSVALEGARALVSAPSDKYDQQVDRYGAVYIFEADQLGLNQWGVSGKLTSPRGISGDGFGEALAMNEGQIFVGMPGTQYGARRSGALEVFYRVAVGTPWRFLDRLGTQMEVRGDAFGELIAVDGDWMAISAPNTSINNVEGAGRVYLFRKDQTVAARQWVLHKIFEATTPQRFDYFGRGLALSGDTLVIGESNHNGMCSSAGAISIYTQNQDGANAWGLQQKTDAGANCGDSDQFGYAIAVQGDTMLIGQPNATVNANANSGRVYLWTRSVATNQQWVPSGLLDRPSDLPPKSRFGSSFAINEAEDTLVVGASYPGLRVGGVWVYEQPAMNWVPTTLVVRPNTNGTQIGAVVAINSRQVAVGESNFESGKGRVRLFDKSMGSWQEGASITSPTMPGELFGRSFAMTDTILVVGDKAGNSNAPNWKPKVHVFEWENNQWNVSTKQPFFEAKLPGMEKYGESLAIEADRLFIGNHENFFLANDYGGVVHQYGINTTLPPVVDNITVDLQEDTATQLVLTARPAGEMFTFAQVIAPGNASSFALDAATGLVNYTPAANFNGTDYLVYRATSASRGLSNYGVVLFSVEPVRDQLVVRDMNVDIAQGETKTWRFDYEEVDGRAITITNDTVAQGSLTVTGDEFTYTAPTDYEGVVSFNYTVGNGEDTITRQVNMTVFKPVEPPLFTGMNQNLSFILVKGQPFSQVFPYTSNVGVGVTLAGLEDTGATATPVANGQDNVIELSWTPASNELPPVNRDVSITINNSAGTDTVDMTLTVAQLEFSSPTQGDEVDDATVRVTGLAFAGADVSVELAGPISASQVVSPTASPNGGQFNTQFEQVTNGAYTLTLKQSLPDGQMLSREVSFSVKGLGLDDEPTVENGVKEDGVLVVKDGEPVVLNGILPENAEVTVTLTDKDGNQETFVGEDGGIVYDRENGTWRFKLPDRYIGKEVDVVVIIEDPVTMRKAVVRLRVRSGLYQPLGFDRQRCQSVGGGSFGGMALWWGLMALMFGWRRRRAEHP